MFLSLRFSIRNRAVTLFQLLIMSGNSEKVYYAVGRGREIGIYDSWKECKAQTEGFCNAKYRKFYSLEEANEFITFWKNYSSPVKESVESKDAMEDDRNTEENSRTEKYFHNDQPTKLLPTIKQEPISEQSQSLTACNQLLSPSSPHSFNGRQSQSSVELMTVNLRLDAFERRFDTCLKEIGAMSSEISHLRSDIRDLKESLKSFSHPGTGNSPKKGRDGMLQTILSFSPGSPYNNPNRSFSSARRSSSDSDEPNKKKKRTVKRTLSKSNISETSTYSKSDEAINELLSRFEPEEVDLSSFTVDEEGFVVVYTDGSALSNGRVEAKAGVGVWFGHNHPLNVSQPVIGPPTSITAEIQAARVAMELATKSGVKKLKIHTDSEFLINCATKWIHRWKTNGWTLRAGGTVKNKKELEKLDKAASKMDVRWEKVAGHSKIVGNETADRLANEGAARYRR